MIQLVLSTIAGILLTSVEANLSFSRCGSTLSVRKNGISFLSEEFAVTIPAGVSNLVINLISSENVDLRIKATDDSYVVRRWFGSVGGPFERSITYEGDEITYSGFLGTGDGLGRERFEITSGLSKNQYRVYVSSRSLLQASATISYSWAAAADCEGSGMTSKSVSGTNQVSLGTIPAGITDLYVRVEGSSGRDLNLELYDENNVAIISSSISIIRST